MKKVSIVHGCDGSKDSQPWFKWLKRKFNMKGFYVEIFDMPNIDNPKIEDWIKYLESKIKDVDSETYFVGHSIGCQTIMRFLEKLHKHKKIASCAFIAGLFDLINLDKEYLEIAHPWINEGINVSRVKDHCDNFSAIFSDNDPYFSRNEIKKFENLGAKIILKKNHGHFKETERIPEIFGFLK